MNILRGIIKKLKSQKGELEGGAKSLVTALIVITILLAYLPAINTAAKGGNWTISGALTYLEGNGYTVYADPSGNFYSNTLLPNFDNTYDLGSSSTAYRDLFLGRNASISGTATIGTANVTGTITAATGNIDTVNGTQGTFTTGNFTSLYQNGFQVPTASGTPDYVVGVNTIYDDVFIAGDNATYATGYWVKSGATGQVVYTTASTADVAINWAVVALPATGGEIRLTSGTFSISAPIVIADIDSLTMVGAGRSKTYDIGVAITPTGTTLYLANLSACNMVEVTHTTSACKNLIFRDFTLFGNSGNNASGDGFDFNGANCLFENISVEWIKGNAFHLTNPNSPANSGNTFQHCFVRESQGHAWLLAANCYDQYWYNCYVSGVRGAHDAWNITSAGGLRFDECEMDNLEQDGINFTNVNDSRITNCTFQGAITEADIRLTSCDNNIITNNHFVPGIADDTVAGILLLGYGTTLKNNIFTNNIFYGGSKGFYYIGSGNDTTNWSNNLIANNQFYGQDSTPFYLVADKPVTIRDNIGYIAPGEVRTYSGTIATLTENAFNSLDNPFGQAVRVLDLQVYVSTAATATSPNIDCGIGSSATTDYATMFDDLPGETIGFYKSTIATPGAQTVPILWASGSGNRYLNMSIKGAAATGMIASYTVTVMGN